MLIKIGLHHIIFYVFQKFLEVFQGSTYNWVKILSKEFYESLRIDDSFHTICHEKHLIFQKLLWQANFRESKIR